MAASRICHGVAKSGSPTPSEMTPVVFWTSSKKSRIPDRGIPATWFAMKVGRDVDMGEKR